MSCRSAISTSIAWSDRGIRLVSTTGGEQSFTTMATSEKHGTLQFLGVAFLIIAGLFAIFSLSFFWQQIQVLRSWPVRQAQVIRSQVVVLPTGKHDQIYAAKLEIAYAVNGKLVTAELTSFQSSNYQATLR